MTWIIHWTEVPQRRTNPPGHRPHYSRSFVFMRASPGSAKRNKTEQFQRRLCNLVRPFDVESSALDVRCSLKSAFSIQPFLTDTLPILTDTLPIQNMHFDQCSCGSLPTLPIQPPKGGGVRIRNSCSFVSIRGFEGFGTWNLELGTFCRYCPDKSGQKPTPPPGMFLICKDFHPDTFQPSGSASCHRTISERGVYAASHAEQLPDMKRRKRRVPRPLLRQYADASTQLSGFSCR